MLLQLVGCFCCQIVRHPHSLNASQLTLCNYYCAIMVLHMPTACSMQRMHGMVRPVHTRRTANSRVVCCSAADGNKRVIKGKCFVTKDVRAGAWNLDQHLVQHPLHRTLTPTKLSQQSTSPLCHPRYAGLVAHAVVVVHHHNSQPDEYEKLGSYALIGLPDELYPQRYACHELILSQVIVAQTIHYSIPTSTTTSTGIFRRGL